MNIYYFVLNYCSDLEKIVFSHVNKECKSNFTEFYNKDNICNVIAKRGYVSLFKWAQNLRFRTYPKTMERAILYYNADIVKLIGIDKLTKNDVELTYYCIKDREIIDFVYNNYSDKDHGVAFTRKMATYGHYYLINKENMNVNVSLNDIAAHIGQSGCIKTYEHFLEIDNRLSEFTCIRDIIYESIINNKRELFEYIVAKYPQIDISYYYKFSRAFRDPRMLDCVLELGCSVDIVLFRKCVMNRKYDIVMKYIDVFTNEYDEESFIIAVNNQDLRMINILYHKNINHNYSEILRTAIISGDTHIVNYLTLLGFKMPNDAIDLSLDCEDYNMYTTLIALGCHPKEKIPDHSVTTDNYTADIIFTKFFSDKHIEIIKKKSIDSIKQINIEDLKKLYEVKPILYSVHIFVYQELNKNDVNILKQEMDFLKKALSKLEDGNSKSNFLINLSIFFNNCNFLKYLINIGHTVDDVSLFYAIQQKNENITKFIISTNLDTLTHRNVNKIVKNGMINVLDMIRDLRIDCLRNKLTYAKSKNQYETVKWFINNNITQEKECDSTKLKDKKDYSYGLTLEYVIKNSFKRESKNVLIY